MDHHVWNVWDHLELIITQVGFNHYKMSTCSALCGYEQIEKTHSVACIQFQCRISVFGWIATPSFQHNERHILEHIWYQPIWTNEKGFPWQSMAIPIAFAEQLFVFVFVVGTCSTGTCSFNCIGRYALYMYIQHVLAIVALHRYWLELPVTM